jgi:hypothetical protein
LAARGPAAQGRAYFGRFPAVKTAGYYQSSGWLAGLFARLADLQRKE